MFNLSEKNEKNFSNSAEFSIPFDLILKQWIYFAAGFYSVCMNGIFLVAAWKSRLILNQNQRQKAFR